ncbi:MAG: FAD-dependent oxidoreductase [Flavobacteriales bacterium]|nr:FAD-dependent oxidoreductase [Flavobacteriales bacterium]
MTGDARTVELVLSPGEAADPVIVRAAALEAAGEGPATGLTHQVLRRSIDARSRPPRIRLRVALVTGDGSTERPPAFVHRDVHKAPTLHIVGCGPAGLFCALRAIELGIRPVLLERGKDVRARRRDLAAINRAHLVDPDSNYCFGEGGAGTYSDGKLYTRSTKRGDVRGVLDRLVAFGASPDILVDAHPHVGTNKLPGIITAMRDAILAAGGEVHFGRRVTDLIMEGGRTRGLRTLDGTEMPADHVVLATGHSARDIFRMLHAKGIRIERKDFAIGVRVEHPQTVIDSMQYHCATRDPLLPPASYSLVEQVDGHGVYSFCMCPGGIIAPCATAPDEVVTNGWSPSKRNNPFANSGLVVDTRSLRTGPGALAGMETQRAVEHLAWRMGGGTQCAPAQRMEDLIAGRLSADLPACSYPPGIVSAPLNELLPPPVMQRLRTALVRVGKRMRGFRTNEAVLVAVESRTSSPVRIPRDPDTLEHPEVEGLYPCGEGAGYAGGIVSAAMDGMRVAERIAARMGRSVDQG